MEDLAAAVTLRILLAMKEDQGIRRQLRLRRETTAGSASLLEETAVAAAAAAHLPLEQTP